MECTYVRVLVSAKAKISVEVKAQLKRNRTVVDPVGVKTRRNLFSKGEGLQAECFGLRVVRTQKPRAHEFVRENMYTYILSGYM